MKTYGADGRDNQGVVFDIQRAALRDGPGIRTTVFLKGCPLSCLWCHNPEAVDFKLQLYFNPEKCVVCGDCASVCADEVHHIQNDAHSINFSNCTLCGDCVQSCNQQALKIIGRKVSIAEVLQEVMADYDFYEQSGGGLTLSGGEPMAQFSFTLDLLKAAKKAGIHTCLDTSGFAPQKRYEEILPYVDLFLLDYKITGSAEHQRYTGVPNEQILSNLQYLYLQEKAIILRCPIIPTINDTQTHFQAIADLSARYPNLSGIEILPYHDMGRNKRTNIGLPATLVGLKTTPAEIADGWLDQIQQLGCEIARIG